MTDTYIEDDLVAEEEASNILRQKPRTLTVWRSIGKGPRYLKLGRNVFYRRQWLREYMESCAVDTSKKGVRG